MSKKTKKKNPILIILCIVLALVLIVFGVLFFVFSKKKNADNANDPNATEASGLLENFSVDETYFICGNESRVTFTVKASDDVSNVDLYMDSEKVGKMYDDGSNGDAASNDGIYTYSYAINSDTEKECKYYAKANNETKSGTQTIRFFDSLTIDDYNNFTSVFEKIQTIEQDYEDSYGNVDETKTEPCLLAVENYAKELKEQNLAYNYEVFNVNNKPVSISIKLESGLEIVYVPNDEDKLASGKQLTMMTQINSVFDEEEDRAEANKLYSYPVDGMNDLGDPHSWTKDGEITLDSIEQMGQNQVILWLGHGVPTSKCTYLNVQESYDKIKFWITDPVYFLELAFVQSKMCISGSGTLAVNYKYLEDKLPNLTGSFVYLLSCTSGDDPKLCNAFINKGAVSLIAVKNSILSHYGIAMQTTLGFLLTQINSETDNYYTVDEAMAKCYKEFGTDDGQGASVFVYQGGNYRIANAQGGILSGKICKASDRVTAIPNATIEVYKDGNLRKTVTSDNSGNYSIELPAGIYIVKITCNGYIEFKSYAEIKLNENTYMETFLLIEGSEEEKGVASGKVINSLTGEGAEGVTIKFKRNWNNTNEAEETVNTTVSGTNGDYSIELPLGNYSAVVSKDGFKTTSFNIIVQKTATANQNGTITPLISGDNYLITLTWGENPRDLDSHVQGTLRDGNSFHVYFSNKNAYDGDVQVCNLDYDDTSSYGPEHITLKATSDEPYYYYIHRYSGSGALISSEAQITIEQGNTLIAKFNVPTNLSTDDYWNVFAIVDGRIVTKNTITPQPDIEYAGH